MTRKLLDGRQVGRGIVVSLTVNVCQPAWQSVANNLSFALGRQTPWDVHRWDLRKLLVATTREACHYAVQFERQ